MNLSIVKIGGNIIDDEFALQKFLKDFASLDGYKILVHGGGKIASRIGEKLGIVSRYVDGRRLTDDETLDLVTMVYGGLVNKKLVTSLQKYGCNSIGLTGADGNTIPAKKRPVKTIDYGWAGDLTANSLNSNLLSIFLENGLTPVFAPLSHDGEGHMLNTNADTIASSLGVALSRHYHVNLLYCFEKKGVLQSLEDDSSVIPFIHFSKWEELKENGTLHSGILPKIENAFHAIQQGVDRVTIGHAEDVIINIKGDPNQIPGTIITT